MEFPEFNDKIESNRGGINAYIAAEDYQDKFLTYFCPISKLDLKRSKLNELQIETQCRVECKQLSKKYYMKIKQQVITVLSKCKRVVYTFFDKYSIAFPLKITTYYTRDNFIIDVL